MAVLVTAIVLPVLLATAMVSPAAAHSPHSGPRALAARHGRAPLIPGTTYAFRLHFGGLSRSYRLHLPPAAASGQALPLVLNLHGATQNGLLQELQSGMDKSADQNGYLVAYPNGTKVAKVLTPDPVAGKDQFSWNAGVCCGLPVTRQIDDVAFLEQVIADIEAKTPVDPSRIYVTGMSAGGMMAYTMAAEDSGQIAAIASVSGQVELPSIDPVRPVPTMEFHSVNDPIASWAGTAGVGEKNRYSVMQGIDKWVTADQCSTEPQHGKKIVGATDTESAGESAELVTYSGCAGGAEVALWRLTGSGHVWPGAPFNLGPPSTWILQGVGRGTVLVNANQTMWDFFQQYSLPAG
jgi:polyhydroxybutyrate depolymerase